MDKSCSECGAKLRKDNASGLCGYHRDRAYKTSAAGKATALRLNTARYKKFKEWINALKLEKGCADCGYRAHPSALDFDHLPGTKKLFSIGAHGSGRARDKVMAEIAKCEVVCANCHRVRTFNRLNGTAVPSAP